MKQVILALFLSACGLSAQDQHIAWKLKLEPASAPPGGTVLLHIDGHLDDGWHIYSLSSPAVPPTKFELAPNPAIEKVRALQPTPKRAYDPNFSSETETFEGDVAFILEIQLQKDAPAGPADLALKARYQTCNAKQCVPTKWSGTASLTVDPAVAAYTPTLPAGYAEPVTWQLAPGSPATPDSQGLLAFLAVAFGVGFACIFTPCVFPMIPITMSYFLNRQSGGRRDSIVQATIFCLGIVVLFSGLGLATTAILGPFGVVTLGSNPWVNAFIAALFITFGLSLLGAFEITIPSAILTRLNQGADKGGFIGSLLMGLTFSLASFACVGPFVGTLLAASVSGGKTRPLLGMITFSAGLALPFFLLALFPNYLKRMPRSGGWMSRIKVVMGFVILAFSLKYLSSLDQVLQYGFLTRERFLAAWVVLFALPGLYLLGFLRMDGIKSDEPVGLGRLLPGAAFLVFALSLLPGMFGGKLGDLDAYVPVSTQPAGLGGASGGEGAPGLVFLKNQYREALAQARAEGKRVLITFTGYACANCHWMKANMFTRPEIAAALKNFVLVELYTDGTDAESDANQNVELEKFKTIAIPFYAIVDPDEKVIATFADRTTNAAEYLAFLNTAPAPAAAPVEASAAPPVAGGSSFPKASKITGEPFDPGPLSGKVTVINFWATWCVPCISEIPSFNKLHKELSSKGVAVVGIAMDEEGATRVSPFLKKHPMDYPVALGAEALNAEYKLDALPVTVILDRTGRQVKRFDGLTSETELLAAIRQTL